MNHGSKMEIKEIISPDTTFTFQVYDTEAPARLDTYISKQFPQYSRNFFQKLIDAKHIKLNGITIHKQGTVLKADDVITVYFPPERTYDPATLTSLVEAQNLAIELIFEHEQFLIVYKPASIMVHAPSSKSSDITLVDWLLAHHKELATIGASNRPGIVHRLDKDTSGLLIIPRTTYAHTLFGTMFKDRLIKKTYYAIVQGQPAPTGTIDFPIGRDQEKKIKMKAYTHHISTATTKRLMAQHNNQTVDPNARQSLTHYSVEKYFKNAALVKVNPITGRTHQIRVHLASIGHPLIGDHIYGKKSALINRQALHAYSLSFTFDGQQFTFSKEIPEDFKKTLSILQEKKC